MAITTSVMIGNSLSLITSRQLVYTEGWAALSMWRLLEILHALNLKAKGF